MRNVFYRVLRAAIVLILFCAPRFFYSQTFSSTSSVDWTKPNFSSRLTLDLQKAGIPLPSGRSAAVDVLQMQLPLLIKDALLSIPVNSLINLGDLVVSDVITLEELTAIMFRGKSSAGVFSAENNNMELSHSIPLTSISSLMVAHHTVYMPAGPLDRVPTRPYSGIIIDARGMLPVQGEFTSTQAVPCLFPKIWDENMNLLFERNMVDPQTAKRGDIVQYAYSDNFTDYESRVGSEPLYIKARRVYGKNRTDPIISKTDALRILSIPENISLIRQGKIVILLEKDKLIHPVKAPIKTPPYYALYNTLVQHFYNTKVPDIKITDTYNGILISLNDIKFVADTSRILPQEAENVKNIVQTIKTVLPDTKFTILVEGHTARVGRIDNEQELSEARAKTIVDQMVLNGIPAEIIQHRGYGGTVPVAENDSEAGRAQNRRVEIMILPEFAYTVWY